MFFETCGLLMESEKIGSPPSMAAYTTFANISGLEVGCHERLGGMLKYYNEAAA